MVDVVTNHMGYAGCGTCVDYSVYDTFNEQSYFHDFCLIDYDNETSVQVVCLASLLLFVVASANNCTVLGRGQYCLAARSPHRRH